MASRNIRPSSPPSLLSSPVKDVADAIEEDDLVTPNGKSQIMAGNSSSNSGIVALFLRSLRFLDLHLLADWPGIALDTFKAPAKESHVKQKARIQSAEWVLYRLFELWDLKETKISLRPYFPAFEPVQSTKLRANLFQWLNRLKETRALGRDYALRKSMLDDCKGERFEEVLFLLSFAVLRKIVGERKSQGCSAAAQRVFAMNHMTAADESALLDPLLIAHVNSLAFFQRQKGAERIHLQRLSRILNSKQKALDEQVENSRLIVFGCDTFFKTKGVDIDVAKKTLRHEVVSDARVLNVFISGEASNRRNTYYDQEFETVWQNRWKNGKQTNDAKGSTSSNKLLDVLERQIQEQRTRIENWRTFQGELSRRNEELITPRSPIKQPARPSKQSSRPLIRSSPKKSPRKAHSPDKTRSRSRPVSMMVEPSSSGVAGSSTTRQEAAVQRASQRLSHLTMDLGRLDLGNGKESTTDMKGHLQKNSTPPTANSFRSQPLPPPAALIPSPLTTIPAPTILAGRRSPTKIPQGLSRLPRPGHHRGSTTDIPSQSLPIASKRCLTLSKSALQDINTNEADPPKKGDTFSQEALSSSEASEMFSSHTPDASCLSAKDTVTARKADDFTTNAESKSKDASQEVSGLIETQTLAERTRQSLAMSDARMSLTAEIFPARPPGSKKGSEVHPNSSFQKGHNKTMSLPKPRFPVNPFDDSSQRDVTTSSQMSPILSNMTSDPHPLRAEEPVNSITSTSASRLTLSKEPGGGIKPEAVQVAPSPSRLTKEEPIQEEDADNVFKSRSKLRRSPPPPSLSSTNGP